MIAILEVIKIHLDTFSKIKISLIFNSLSELSIYEIFIYLLSNIPIR